MKKRLLTMMMGICLAVSTLLTGCGSNEDATVQTGQIIKEDVSQTGGSTAVTNANSAEYEAAKATLAAVKAEVDPFFQVIQNNQNGGIQLSDLQTVIEDVATARNQAQNSLPAGELKDSLLLCYTHMDTILQGALNIHDLKTIIIGLGDEISELGATYEDDLEGMYQAIIALYEKYSKEISVAPEYQQSYQRLIEALQLLQDVVIKEYKATQLQDYVTEFAAESFQERVTSQLSVYSNALADDITYNQAVLQERCNVVTSLMASVEDGFENPNAYVAPSLGQEQVVEVTYADVIFPQQYSTYDSVLILRGYSLTGPMEVVVEAEIQGFTQKYTQTITLDTTCSKLYVKPSVLTTANLSKARTAQLDVKITKKDGTLMAVNSYPITIKSRNDFDFDNTEYYVSDKYGLLCMLEPENDKVADLKRQAVEYLSGLTDGEMTSMCGYQGDSSKRFTITAAQVVALQYAMSDMGIRYVMDPYSVSNSSQSIYLPSETIERRSGLCVETALVMASALQSLNMHAFLVFPEGHCQVAVETWYNSGEYFLIETTLLPVDDSTYSTVDLSDCPEYMGSNIGYGIVMYLSQEEWNYYLQYCDIIDCNDAHSLGLSGL